MQNHHLYSQEKTHHPRIHDRRRANIKGLRSNGSGRHIGCRADIYTTHRVVRFESSNFYFEICQTPVALLQ